MHSSNDWNRFITKDKSTWPIGFFVLENPLYRRPNLEIYPFELCMRYDEHEIKSLANGKICKIQECLGFRYYEIRLMPQIEKWRRCLEDTPVHGANIIKRKTTPFIKDWVYSDVCTFDSLNNDLNNWEEWFEIPR